VNVDGLVVNPGAWSHYSWAIRDALELLEVPFVEVHLSDIDHREEWRRVSVVAEIASHRVIGKGPDGYREALEFLAGKVEG
jgi:3-dehydroquinate dehydratase-2